MPKTKSLISPRKHQVPVSVERVTHCHLNISCPQSYPVDGHGLDTSQLEVRLRQLLPAYVRVPASRLSLAECSRRRPAQNRPDIDTEFPAAFETHDLSLNLRQAFYWGKF